MRACRSLFVAAAVWCAAAGSASAQGDDHAACAAMGWVPREILERPLPLRAGIGNAHEARHHRLAPRRRPSTTRGLNYLHGYVWIEAARSFRQALRLDPKLAMAWLGLAACYSGLDDPEAARQRALAQAEALGARPARASSAGSRCARKQLEAMDDLGNAGRPRGVQEGDRRRAGARHRRRRAVAAARQRRGGDGRRPRASAAASPRRRSIGRRCGSRPTTRRRTTT